MRRLEQKFYAPSSPDAQRLKTQGNLEPLAVRRESDTHFLTRDGAVFLRRTEDGGGNPWLIRCQRLSTPLPWESVSISVPATDLNLEALLAASFGVRARIDKTRSRHRAHCEGVELMVDLDEVDGLGSFVELSADLDGDDAVPQGEAAIRTMVERLGLSGADALPYSYADLAVMMAASVRYREQLATAGQAGKVGRMMILDGASCSGKTTLGTWLLEEAEAGLALVPRYTTRAPRPEETVSSEYIFTSPEELHRLTNAGELFEYRDFEFGMSYGLPWGPAVELLTSGRDGLGIMNLGNIRHVKRVFPEAVTVLIHAPLPVIERRLRDRGMPEGHIAERLGNARRVESYRDFYDHVVNNDDGHLEAAQAALLGILGS